MHIYMCISPPMCPPTNNPPTQTLTHHLAIHSTHLAIHSTHLTHLIHLTTHLTTHTNQPTEPPTHPHN